MSSFNKVVKAKTKKGDRAISNTLPKLIENVKTILFVKGATANGNMIQVLKDFNSLKKPNTVFFNRKNDYTPFQNHVPLEFFARKNDASLQMFASHNKKRPNNLVMSRYFNHQLLDMIELGVENFVSIEDYDNCIKAGFKPQLIFNGDFETEEELVKFKNMMIDFFRGPVVNTIALDGLEHAMVFTKFEDTIFFRNYKVVMKNSGTRVPKVEIEEVGPSMDFVLRRNKFASSDLYKEACKQPRQLRPSKTKNVVNKLGSQYGTIHMQRQDFSTMAQQTRKFTRGRKFDQNKESKETTTTKTEVKMETE